MADETRKQIRKLLEAEVGDPMGKAMGITSEKIPLGPSSYVIVERWGEGKRALIVSDEEGRVASVLLDERQVRQVMEQLAQG